jgi:hypothetical protein
MKISLTVLGIVWGRGLDNLNAGNKFILNLTKIIRPAPYIEVTSIESSIPDFLQQAYIHGWDGGNGD